MSYWSLIESRNTSAPADNSEIVRLAALLDAGQLEEFGAARKRLLAELKGVKAAVLDAEIKKHRRVEAQVGIDDGYGDDEDTVEDDGYDDDAEASAAAPPEGESCPSKGKFSMNPRKGLYIKTDKGPKWVCVPFYILGHGRNPFGLDHGKYIRIQDVDRLWKTRYISNIMIAGDPGALCAYLYSAGMVIARTQYLNFASYLTLAKVKSRVIRRR